MMAAQRGDRLGYLDRIEVTQDAIAREVKGVKREMRALRAEMRTYFAALVVVALMMWASVIITLMMGI